MRDHIRKDIGNGKSTFFWHDKWWEGGIIRNSIPIETILDADCKVKVSDMITNGEWNWPDSWNNDYPWLENIPVPRLKQHDDRTVWINNEGNKVEFSMSIICRDWMNNGEKVLWHKVLWFSQCTPKHSFILWLAILKRLNTQDRLMKWYPGKSMTCPLCDERPDSHKHLFFKCKYSATIWSDLKERINLREISDDLDDIMYKLVRMVCNNSIRSIVRRIVFAASIYFIWNERNNRLFGNQKRSSKDVLLSIVNSIRLKLTSLKVKTSLNTRAIERDWKISMNSDICNDKLMEKWDE